MPILESNRVAALRVQRLITTSQRVGMITLLITAARNVSDRLGGPPFDVGVAADWLTSA